MGFKVFAYQVFAGSDESLHFAASYDEVYDAALQQRQELKAVGDISPQRLGTMAIYECELKTPDRKTIINALNSHDDPRILLDGCMVDKRLIVLLQD
jgi:hypothetical protein